MPRVRLTGSRWNDIEGREYNTLSDTPRASGWYQIIDEGGQVWNVNPKEPRHDYGCTILPDFSDPRKAIRATIERGLMAQEDSDEILAKIITFLED